MKKLITLVLALTLCAGLCACGANPAEPVKPKPTAESIQIPNPVTECTAQELAEKTGLSLTPPEGAVDAAYSYIDQGEEGVVAQMTFTLDGVTAALRACSAGIPEETLPDISGLYYDWAETGAAPVGYNDAQLCWNEGEAGYIAWYDYAPGLLYCLSVTQGAAADTLTALANAAYVPVQGDA